MKPTTQRMLWHFNFVDPPRPSRPVNVGMNRRRRLGVRGAYTQRKRIAQELRNARRYGGDWYKDVLAATKR